MTHVIALSGGKDSTALALRLAEVDPRDYTYLITPTGDELPEMLAHWEKLEGLLGKPLTRITNGTLNSWIEHFKALPNGNMRWCTRLLKIEPAILFYKLHAPCTAYVGLRADEPVDERVGIYGQDTPQRFPLREWGWGVADVIGYLKRRGVSIPTRTDCARCYAQRLGEWRALLKKHPDIYAEAERQELEIGHTFRSKSRDTKPAQLIQLRAVFEEEQAIKDAQGTLFDAEFCDDDKGACRVCSL